MPNGQQPNPRVSGGLFGQRYGIEGPTTAAKTMGDTLRDRWWKKELEEFKEGPYQRFQQTVNQLGQLEKDESIDVGQFWSMTQSAIMDLNTEAVKYTDNPYVGQVAASIMEGLKGAMGDMTQGITRQAQARQATTAAKRSEELLPLEKERMKAQTGAERARQAAEEERLAGLQRAGMKEDRGTLYGPMTGSPEGWMSIAEASDEYSTRLGIATRTAAETAWMGEEGDLFREQTLGMGKKEDFVKGFFLSPEQKAQFDAGVADDIVAQLEIHPDYADTMKDSMMGGRVTKMARALEARKTDVQLNVGSAGLNRILFGDDALGAGRAVDVRPVDKITRGSPASTVLNEYDRLRKAGHDHPAAMEMIIDDGAIDGAIVNSKIDVTTPGGLASGKNAARELVELLEDQRDRYDIMAYEREALKEGKVGGLLPALEEMVSEGWKGPLGAIMGLGEAGKEALLGEELPEVVRELGTYESVKRAIDFNAKELVNVTGGRMGLPEARERIQAAGGSLPRALAQYTEELEVQRRGRALPLVRE